VEIQAPLQRATSRASSSPTNQRCHSTADLRSCWWAPPEEFVKRTALGVECSLLALVSHYVHNACPFAT